MLGKPSMELIYLSRYNTDYMAKNMVDTIQKVS